MITKGQLEFNENIAVTTLFAHLKWNRSNPMTQHLTVGTFGKLTGLTPKVLRLYEQEGFLQPEVVNAEMRYRYYTKEQARVAESIRLLRSIDVPLDDIRPHQAV
jgi:MerR HTH family regulatory protein